MYHIDLMKLPAACEAIPGELSFDTQPLMPGISVARIIPSLSAHQLNGTFIHVHPLQTELTEKTWLDRFEDIHRCYPLTINGYQFRRCELTAKIIRAKLQAPLRPINNYFMHLLKLGLYKQNTLVFAAKISLEKLWQAYMERTNWKETIVLGSRAESDSSLVIETISDKHIEITTKLNLTFFDAGHGYKSILCTGDATLKYQLEWYAKKPQACLSINKINNDTRFPGFLIKVIECEWQVKLGYKAGLDRMGVGTNSDHCRQIGDEPSTPPHAIPASSMRSPLSTAVSAAFSNLYWVLAYPFSPSKPTPVAITINGELQTEDDIQSQTGSPPLSPFKTARTSPIWRPPNRSASAGLATAAASPMRSSEYGKPLNTEE